MKNILKLVVLATALATATACFVPPTDPSPLPVVNPRRVSVPGIVH